jgi:hypothetical protein
MRLMATEPPFEHDTQVFQAAGIVSVQADCLIEQAIILMDARAELNGVALDEIAAAVLDQSITFGEPGK